MSENSNAINLKIKKAEALMAEVDFLLENKFYTTAVSRIYYSCFHAVKALLLTKDLIPKTHSGVISMLGQHFVKQENLIANILPFLVTLCKKEWTMTIVIL